MWVRQVVRTFSELCITAGLVIVLFVLYLLQWTGVRADSAGEGEIGRLQEKWVAGTAGPGREDEDGADSGEPDAYRDGESFAVMYIPRFGGDWAKPVLENTAVGTLRKGLGHYTGSARPGGEGNFAVAGHRRTYGDPFKDFPRLRPGDPVVVSDGKTWFTYRIDRRPYRTLPSDTGVLDPVPEPARAQAAPYPRPGRYLTLTTCEPEWGSSHRLIAWAHLDSTQPVTEGEPEALEGMSG